MAVDDKVEFIGNFLILFISYDLLNYILKPTRWLQQMNLQCFWLSIKSFASLILAAR